MGVSLCCALNSEIRFCSLGIRSRKTSFKSLIKCKKISAYEWVREKPTVACVDE